MTGSRLGCGVPGDRGPIVTVPAVGPAHRAEMVTALDSLSLTPAEQELVTVLGANGSAGLRRHRMSTKDPAPTRNKNKRK